MAKFKYLIIFIIPLSAIWSFHSFAWQSSLPVIIAFIIVPTLELFLKPDHSNLNKISAEIAEKSNYYTLVLVAVLPCQLLALYYFLSTWNVDYTLAETIGRIASMGIMCGVFGINVGHELGHKDNRFEQLIGEVLLLTSLETHFLVYHNYGHHFDVATPKDPATARKNEWLFSFWFRSQIGSYFKAWQLQTKLLKIKKTAFFSFSNRMLWYTIFQTSLCLSIYLIFNLNVLLYFSAAAIFGILLLETVNYIEHYGLLRKQKKSGRYEVVNPMHSWNSDHVVGRLLLFELSRHSDHHHRANKPYQILDSHPESPQMITGYPGMMLLALVPPLWFQIMNKKLPK